MSVAVLSGASPDLVAEELVKEIEESVAGRRSTLYAAYGKRVLDFVGALVLLVLVLPVLLIAAAAVRLSGPGVLFRQRRAGYGGSEFTIYKFRTMRPDRRSAVRPF